VQLVDRDSLQELRSGVAVDCAHLAALQARIGRQLVEVEDTEAWCGPGIRSMEQWASMALGLAATHTRSLVTTSRKLAVLPLLDGAVREGRISFDKARAVAPLATPATQERWMDLADQATVTGLQRIVAAWRKVTPEGDADEPAGDPRQRRSLRWTAGPDGLEKLIALLTPEDAAVVKAALGNATEDDWRQTPADDRADEPAAARAADALVAVAETAMAAGPQPCECGDRNKVSLVIDLGLLLGRKVDGLCGIEASPLPLPLADAELLCCDAVIRPLVFNGQNPIDVGRDHHTVNRAQRRALKARDGGCRFPGCAATRYVDAHHVDHWIRGGRTDLANLLLLCRFHHRLHHRGGYQIHATALPGRYRFIDPDGHEIGPPPHPPPVDLRTVPGRTGIEPTWLTPHAKDAGTPLHLDPIISGIRWAHDHDPNRAN
jgi:hypothetical protein